MAGERGVEREGMSVKREPQQRTETLEQMKKAGPMTRPKTLHWNISNRKLGGWNMDFTDTRFVLIVGSIVSIRFMFLIHKIDGSDPDKSEIWGNIYGGLLISSFPAMCFSYYMLINQAHNISNLIYTAIASFTLAFLGINIVIFAPLKLWAMRNSKDSELMGKRVFLVLIGLSLVVAVFLFFNFNK